jgi:hypothetical protein
MDDFVQLVDSNHIKELVSKIERELMPMLDHFRFELNTEANRQKIQREVDAYFIDCWIAHAGHNVQVEVGPNNGLIVTALINYQNDPVSEFEIDEYQVDYWHRADAPLDITGGFGPAGAMCNCDTGDDGKTIPEHEPRSPDDILFEPIKKPEPVKDDSVLDDFLDGMSLDDMLASGREKLVDVLKSKPEAVVLSACNEIVELKYFTSKDFA